MSDLDPKRMGRCALKAWETAVDTFRAGSSRSGVTTAHILLGVLKEDDCASGLILRGLGLDLAYAVGITEFLLLHSRRQSDLPDEPQEWAGVPHSAQAKLAIEYSYEEADLYSSTYPIGTEHFLLAVLRIPEGMGCRTMDFLGIDERAVRAKRDRLWTHLRSAE